MDKNLECNIKIHDKLISDLNKKNIEKDDLSFELAIAVRMSHYHEEEHIRIKLEHIIESISYIECLMDIFNQYKKDAMSEQSNIQKQKDC